MPSGDDEEKERTIRMKTLTELFEHELRDIYYAEHRLVEALGQLAQQSIEPTIQKAFTEHQEQTRGHIKRLEQVFSLIHEQPSAVTCPGVDGLIKEHDSFMKEAPTPQLLQLYDISAGIKSERYEISAYEGLIQMARQLNRSDDIVPLLEENLREELAALKKLDGFSKAYNPLGQGKLESGKGMAEGVKDALHVS